MKGKLHALRFRSSWRMSSTVRKPEGGRCARAIAPNLQRDRRPACFKRTGGRAARRSAAGADPPVISVVPTGPVRPRRIHGRWTPVPGCATMRSGIGVQVRHSACPRYCRHFDRRFEPSVSARSLRIARASSCRSRSFRGHSAHSPIEYWIRSRLGNQTDETGDVASSVTGLPLLLSSPRYPSHQELLRLRSCRSISCVLTGFR